MVLSEAFFNTRLMPSAMDKRDRTHFVSIDANSGE